MSENLSYFGIMSAIEKCLYNEYENDVKNGFVNVNEKYDENGYSVVYLVTSSKRLDMEKKYKWFKLLKSLNADFNQKIINDLSPLGLAVSRSDTDLIKALVEMGADIHEKDNATGTSLLFHTKDEKTIKCLVEFGLDLNLKNKNGMTPIENAIRSRNKEAIKCLIDLGAIIDGIDENSNAIVTMAVGDIEIIKYLTDLGIDVDLKDKTEETAMHKAAALGDINSINCLVSLGADINTRNDQGFSPIFYSAMNGHVESMQCMKSHGADINTKSNDGQSIITFFGDNIKPEVLKWLNDNGVN